MLSWLVRRMAKETDNADVPASQIDYSILPCITSRRSIFPNAYAKDDAPELDDRIISSLLAAARYGPFHGGRYKQNMHPAKFVVLKKQGMVEMQKLTLRYYDMVWEEHWSTREDYLKWRATTEGEITGRWGPCTHMIAIVARRRSGPRVFPEWEELAATACAVQNMHLQSTKYEELACYWSSWHDAARDSRDMREFLGMSDEDRCLGFFVVARAKNPKYKPRRIRNEDIMEVVWRP